MDNENIRIEFVNGSSITGRYEPYQNFQYIDTRTPFDTIEVATDSGPVRIARENIQRGHRVSGLVYDEFADFDWLKDYSEPLVDMFNSINTGYTVYIDGDKITIKQKEAPDFGEISPSQELNDFINTLVQGE